MNLSPSPSQPPAAAPPPPLSATPQPPQHHHHPPRTQVDSNDSSTPKQNHHHDTHAQVPYYVYQAHLKYNRISIADLDADESVIDFNRGLTPSQRDLLKVVKTIPAQVIAEAGQQFEHFDGERIPGSANGFESTDADPGTVEEAGEECKVYEHSEFPGLRIYPGLVPPKTQLLLLSRLMHRDLSVPEHKTNINLEYEVPYPEFVQTSHSESESGDQDTDASQQPARKTKPHCRSFFTRPLHSPHDIFHPKSQPTTSNSKPKPPLDLSQVLRKKLRYLTLGAQYDWATRSYPPVPETPFPADIACLVSHLFPGLKSESGVVLFYGAKDYMPPHRDVSELAETGLASFTVGCEGVFLVAREKAAASSSSSSASSPSSSVPPSSTSVPSSSSPASSSAAQKAQEAQGGGQAESGEEEEPTGSIAAIRVRSGDVIQMDGETRWAWHAMPRIIPGTCPGFMGEWPAEGEEMVGEEKGVFEPWRGFMRGMRVNISVRQVYR